MTKQEIKPDHAPWVSPYIMVRDVDKSVDFYKKAFHFDVREVAPGEDGTSMHAEMTYKGQLVMLGKEGGWGGTSKSPKSSGVESPMTLYVYTDNVDEFYKQALDNKAHGLAQPEDMFWGDRMCKLQDPDDYIWCFATKTGSHK